MIARAAAFAVAALAGAMSGPSALESAAASRPTIGWDGMAWMVVGVAVGTLLIFGVQVALRRARALRWGSVLFFYTAVFFTCAGLSAWVAVGREAARAPEGLLFLAFGVGMFAGLGALRILFRREFARSG